ncbi:DUF2269 family protein [Candidatus Parcubacteria bacterium]|nr:MAG: DUF2269 family protein [Candidatus Parcubacteria bacterium]
MSLYGLLLLIHIIAAVVGLGSTFAMPVLMSTAKTVTQAKFSHSVAGGIEKFAKIGSITLLLTGIAMGAVSPYLFKEIWFIASLVIYVLVQPIVAGILPKKNNLQIQILEKANGEELPTEYQQISKQLIPINNIVHISAIILIILMTIKPF